MKKTIYKAIDGSLIKEEPQINTHKIGDTVSIDSVNYKVKTTATDTQMEGGELISKIKTYVVE